MNKYQQAKGYYVYCHIAPDMMVYIGISKQKTYDRWQKSAYKETSLQQYIEKYDWDEFIHIILKDNLTKSEAEHLEDYLIDFALRSGFCINKQRSGGLTRDNFSEYRRRTRQSLKYKEYQREYGKKYKKTEKYKEKERNRVQSEEFKVRRREYMREYRASHRNEKSNSDGVVSRLVEPEIQVIYCSNATEREVITKSSLVMLRE